MQPHFKKFPIILFVSALLVICVQIIQYHHHFGVWNPFQMPARLNCYDRQYHFSDSPTHITSSTTVYPISAPYNETGKALYTPTPKEEGIPGVIFLKTGDGRFLSYKLYYGS